MRIKIKKITMGVIFITIAISQLIFVISVRSNLVWKYHRHSEKGGEATIIIPPTNFLLGNKYDVRVSAYFAYTSMADTVGNLSFEHLETGETFFFQYILKGESMYMETVREVKQWTMPPGEYNVKWNNSNTNYNYEIISHGFFSNPAYGVYPYDGENLALFLSLIITFFLFVLGIGVIVIKIDIYEEESIEEYKTQTKKVLGIEIQKAPRIEISMEEFVDYLKISRGKYKECIFVSDVLWDLDKILRNRGITNYNYSQLYKNVEKLMNQLYASGYFKKIKKSSYYFKTGN